MSDVSRDTMLLTTPFHSRVEAMCDLNDWGNWMGYTTPNAYFDVELEYFAVRSTTGVFDLSPMNKYRVTGPDAQRYLDRLPAETGGGRAEDDHLRVDILE